MDDTLVLNYFKNDENKSCLQIRKLQLVNGKSGLPDNEAYVINTFKGEEADKIYDLLTSSYGTVITIDDVLKTMKG